MARRKPSRLPRTATGLLLVVFATASPATVIVTPPAEVYNWDVDVVVPDSDPVGVADTRFISNSQIVSITDLTVSLEMSGGYAGDLYVSLTHDSGFSVLLNRVGRSTSNPLGSDATTLILSLRDDALGDIHTATAADGTLSGAFQPDSRETSPFEVLDTSSRSASLASFQGLAVNGPWTLFVADVSGADEMRLEGWGLEIAGVIPEPSTSVLAFSAVAILLSRRKRGRRGPEPLAKG